MAEKPGMASKTELPLAQFVELSTAVTKQLPRDLDPKLAQYFIDHPLFLKAVLSELEDVRLITGDQSYTAPIVIPSCFDASAILGKEGQDPDRVLTCMSDAVRAIEVLAVKRAGMSFQPYVLWAEIGAYRTIDLARVLRAKRLRPANAAELLTFISRCGVPKEFLGLVSIDRLMIQGYAHTLRLANVGGARTWHLKNYRSEYVWDTKDAFLAVGEERAV